MSSTRTIGRITVAIGTGIAAVAISLTAPDIASVRPPLCQDDIDCRLQGPTTTSFESAAPDPDDSAAPDRDALDADQHNLARAAAADHHLPRVPAAGLQQAPVVSVK